MCILYMRMFMYVYIIHAGVHVCAHTQIHNVIIRHRDQQFVCEGRNCYQNRKMTSCPDLHYAYVSLKEEFMQIYAF